MIDTPRLFTDAERSQPIRFDSLATLRPVTFRCDSRDITEHRLRVFAHCSDAEFASAVMDFTMWWSAEILPRLNEFPGWDCVEWRIER